MVTEILEIIYLLFLNFVSPNPLISLFEQAEATVIKKIALGETG